MRPQSAKAKGRKLQQWVRDQILKLFPDLEPDDVRSTSMGAGGEDILLSPAARERVPCSFETKNRESLKTLYGFFEQAAENANGHQPVLILKSNNEKPLAVIDAEWFFTLVRIAHDYVAV